MLHKFTLIFALAVLLPLQSGAAAADQCLPITNFIALGKKAEKCVRKIRQGQEKANNVLSNYGFCTNVRDARNDVEKKINALSIATVNNCAGRDMQAYTNAATSIHRLYQIELRLK